MRHSLSLFPILLSSVCQSMHGCMHRGTRTEVNTAATMHVSNTLGLVVASASEKTCTELLLLCFSSFKKALLLYFCRPVKRKERAARQGPVVRGRPSKRSAEALLQVCNVPMIPYAPTWLQLRPTSNNSRCKQPAQGRPPH